MNNTEIQTFLNGNVLYGDNFSENEINHWFEQEQEGYANLGAKNFKHYQYGYHELNKQQGYDLLPISEQSFETVLGFGSAYGDELLPIISKIKHVTIIDPSDAFIHNDIQGVPVSYVKPNSNGILSFDENSFDLITCFGALHHIPNVSKVISELARVLKRGQYMLLREPIVSMGDWRYPRQGLTKNERGIPLQILKKILAHNGLISTHSSLSGFPITNRLCFPIGVDVYNNYLATWLDNKVSETFAWNVNYHPKNILQLFRPT